MSDLALDGGKGGRHSPLYLLLLEEVNEVLEAWLLKDLCPFFCVEKALLDSTGGRKPLLTRLSFRVVK